MGLLDNLKNVLGGRSKDNGEDTGDAKEAKHEGENTAGDADSEAVPSEPSTPEAKSLPHGHAHEQAKGTTYTVQSGDTLWKIAQEHYGNGSEYMRIFEANRGILDDPDRIEPGQELNIPPPQD